MNLSNSIEYFNVPFDDFTLSASRLNSSSKHKSLMIHGGARTQDIFDDLRHCLAEFGISSYAYDCIAHGQSTGQLNNSSLASRTQQALKVIDNAPITTCLGVSMGAYNALKLTQHRQIENLVLIVPGIYTPEAYNTKFGEGFSSIIRRDNSWLDSDAWEILKQFKGNLLIVSAENDEVVPSAIPEKLFDSAIQSNWKHHLIIPKAIHKGFMENVMSDLHRTEFLHYLKKCLSI
jgi:uncharacterized protein